MNLSSIIGQVDWAAATVACSFLFATAATVIVIVIRVRSRRAMDQSFELEKLRMSNADNQDQRIRQNYLEIELSKIGLQRDVEFKRIENGMVDLKVNE